jgi:hypothetical protein
MMQRQKSFGRTMRGLAVAAACAVVPFAGAASQGKELSDDSIRTLMAYAWVITPAKFTAPNGDVIEIDKTKREIGQLPLDIAREIVKTGRLSANAQMCGLAEEQTANYQTMMAREVAKKKWSQQQLLFISQLHLFTVMMMTGGVKVVEKDGDKDVVIENKKLERQKVECSDAERGKIVEQIKRYVNAGAPKQ